MIELHHGDCLEIMKMLPDNSVDSIVTDPPYGLGFMVKAWDALPPGEDWARECLRVLKPGGHLLAFGGTRTWHRLAVAVEDAGFEIRDSVFWLYGSGFPKTQSALKPSCEPIVMARKPITGTLAANKAAHGTGVLNIEACRTQHDEPAGRPHVGNGGARSGGIMGKPGNARVRTTTAASVDGRWPANVILDESQAMQLDASRYFYVAKASASERPIVNEVKHPTVKPLALMRWLVRLITPAGGTVLEPFAGSGATVEACILEGFHCMAIEREAEYLPLIQSRIDRQEDSFWSTLMKGVPAIDESVPITSSDINRQTAARMDRATK